MIAQSFTSPIGFPFVFFVQGTGWMLVLWIKRGVCLQC